MASVKHLNLLQTETTDFILAQQDFDNWTTKNGLNNNDSDQVTHA